jgi:excisionase family DNA binding protein
LTESVYAGIMPPALLGATQHKDCYWVPANFSLRGLLSTAEAAEYLAISTRKFQQIVANADSPIRPRRIGSSVRYKLSDLEAFVDSLPIGKGPDNTRG